MKFKKLLKSKPKFDEELTKSWQTIFEKFWLFLFWFYFFRYFQWCTPKSGIGNGFGVKPKKSLFCLVFFRNLALFGQAYFVPQKMVSDFFWYWWLGIVLQSSRSQNVASKKLKPRREKFFFKSSKTCPKRTKKQKSVDFLKNVKCKHTLLLDACPQNLSCNILLVDVPSWFASCRRKNAEQDGGFLRSRKS